MNILIAVLILCIITSFGSAVAYKLKFKSLMVLPVGFLIGYTVVVVSSLGLFLLNAGQFAPLLLFPMVIWLGYFLIFTLSGKLKGSIGFTFRKGNLFQLLIVMLFAFVFFESLIRPLSAWDGWASWQMRAKAIAYDNKITSDQFHYLQTDYPLAVPLFSAFIYKSIGDIDDSAIPIVSSAFYFMVGFTAFAFLKEKTSLRYASVMTFLILSTQNLIRHGGRFEAGMADIVLAYFILLSVLLFQKAIETKKSSDIVLLVICMALTSQIKNEGLIFSVILALFVSLQAVRTNAPRNWYIIIFGIVPAILWFLAKKLFDLPEGILRNTPILNFETLAGIIRVNSMQIVNLQNWNLGWVYVIFACALYGKRVLKAPVIVLLLQWLAYFLIFLFSSVDPAIHAGGIVDRLYIHLFPSLIVLCAYYMYPNLKKDGLLKRFRLV